MTTIMQPFQCDLQPQTQETHRTTHTGTTTRCRTQRRNEFADETTAAAPAAHRRYTCHRRPKPLYTDNTRFRAPASSPKQSPCNIHAAITLCFAASRSKPASFHTHGNTRWQQSCSHSNAICNHRLKKRIELRTQEQPLVAEHSGGTNSRMKRPQPHPPHTGGIPVIAGRSHFTRKNTRFRAPASSPKHTPCNIHATVTMHFAAFPSPPLPSSPLPFLTTSLCHHFPKP